MGRQWNSQNQVNPTQVRDLLNHPVVTFHYYAKFLMININCNIDSLSQQGWIEPLLQRIKDKPSNIVIPQIDGIRDELNENRSSRKTDSQSEKRSLGSSILLKIVYENQFSGKTYFLYNCLQRPQPRVQRPPRRHLHLRRRFHLARNTHYACCFKVNSNQVKFMARRKIAKSLNLKFTKNNGSF